MRDGNLNPLIGDAERSYAEYLDGEAPEGGFVTMDVWVTQQVAANIEHEVIAKCRQLQRTLAPTAVDGGLYVPTQPGSQDVDPSVVDAEVAAMFKGKGKGTTRERYELYRSA